MRPYLLLTAAAAISPAFGQLTQPKGYRWPDASGGSPSVNISASGNGCPQGSVRWVNPARTNRTSVTSWLYFDTESYNLEIGEGAAVADSTKNCQLHISARYTPGLQFVASAVKMEGRARLEPGVTVSFFNTFYFSQDAATTGTSKTTLAGGAAFAKAADFRRVDSIPGDARIWSPCSGNGILNANMRIALISEDSSGGELDLQDVGDGYSFGLALTWRACPDSSS